MFSLAKFVFGSSKPWERRLVIWRIVTLASAVPAFLVLLNSPWSHLAGVAFWLLALATLASVVYQFARRWRERDADMKSI